MVSRMRAVHLLPLTLIASLAGPAAAQPAPKSVGPDVPPEIPASVYAARRAKLAKALGGCVGVLAAHAKDASEDTSVPVDNMFFWATGVEQVGSTLMIAPREAIYKTVLSLPPRDPEMEIWEGYREPMSFGLRKQYQVDKVARTRGPLPRGFGRALQHARCYGKLKPDFAKEQDVPAEMLGKYLPSFQARSEEKWLELEHLRAVHDAAEIARMDKAIAITIEGHKAAARYLAPGMRERAVASKIDDAFYAHGATGLAFPSIVGSGPDGAILHWEKRNRIMQKDDLVVVDIGSSYGGYASDVTRTFPVSGHFSPEQRKVYEAVLAVQNKVIAAVRPGISLERLNAIADDALVAAGYEPVHYIGHYVGLNVHDAGDFTAPLEPGMVITVEPGAYLKDKLGVRIEDMVLVTPRGHRLMTEKLPRKVAEVEAFMAAARK